MRFSVRLLRSGLSETPGEQLVELRDLVIGDALEDIGHPGLGVDAVEFGGLDQGRSWRGIRLDAGMTGQLRFVAIGVCACRSCWRY